MGKVGRAKVSSSLTAAVRLTVLDDDADTTDMTLHEVSRTRESSSQTPTVCDVSVTTGTRPPVTMLDKVSNERNPGSSMDMMDKAPATMATLPTSPPLPPQSTVPEEQHDGMSFNGVDSVGMATEKRRSSISSEHSLPPWRRDSWCMYDMPSRSSSTKTISSIEKGTDLGWRTICIVGVAVGITFSFLVVMGLVFLISPSSNEENQATHRTGKTRGNMFREVRFHTPRDVSKL